MIMASGTERDFKGSLTTSRLTTMKHVCTITSMTTRSIIPTAAGPGGYANGNSVNLRTRTAVVTSAGRKTASTTVMTKRFAKSGMPESICITGRRGVGTLNSAHRASLSKLFNK